MKSENLKRSKTLEIFRLTVAVYLAAVVMLLVGCAQIDTVKYRLEPIPKLAVLDGVVRNTTSGQIEGKANESQKILAWEGVRFAKPPVGDLRWKAPRELESWTGVKETKKSGSVCTQGSSGSEDCLFMNIYRPDTVEKNLPVYVWIHGGSNVTGKAVDLSYFAKEANVVAVSIQYRMGPLGFFKHDALSTGNILDDSGSYGILDQIQALKWVRKNITSFGGNPRNVTAAGESAGASDIYALLITKEARGLFHKAIVQSPGTASKALSRMKNFSAGYVKKLNLTSTGKELAKDLRAVEAKKLIQAAPKGASFGPIVDGNFIKDPFFCMIESGDYYKVPIIAGGNRNEYTLWMLLSGGPTRKWKRLWKITSSKKRRKTVDQILNAEEKENYALASAMCGRLWQASKVHRAARAIRKYQKDVYVYEFQWGGTKGTDIEFVFGAAHANEIAFFNYEPTFDIWAKNLSITEDNKAARYALAKAMRTYYAQFLHTGNPNGKANIPEWMTWSNDPGGVKTLNLDASSEPGSSELKVFMTKREYVSKDLLQEIENMTHETAKEYSLKIANGWTKSLPCSD